MKKNQTSLKRIFLFATLVLLVTFAQAQITIPKKLQKAIQPNKLPEGITIPATLLQKDIDLAAEAINFSVVRVKDQFNSTVKIEGVVRNVGRLNYTSGAGQQMVLLYEESGGAYALKASRTFQNLAVNATIKVSFTRSWNKSSPAEGEFPPNYILVIAYDPDIYSDGNNNNDDGNSSNNRLTKSGSEINSLGFRM